MSIAKIRKILQVKEYLQKDLRVLNLRVMSELSFSDLCSQFITSCRYYGTWNKNKFSHIRRFRPPKKADIHSARTNVRSKPVRLRTNISPFGVQENSHTSKHHRHMFTMHFFFIWNTRKGKVLQVPAVRLNSWKISSCKFL